MGPKGDRFRPLVDACRRFGVSEVTCDSNGLAALVGRENGRGGGPRPLTAWQATMGDRADAIVMTLGPLRFFEAAMAEYRARGLADATALGRGYSSGLGTILGIEYLPDPDDRSLVSDGKPMRAIPIGHGAPHMVNPFCMLTSTRAPYWAGRGRCVCAVPATRLAG